MKGRYSKFIVVLVIALNIIFAAAVLYAFIRTSSEPSTLVASWYAFTTGELLSLAWIKRKKIEKGGDEE
jgi:hypothetical protein